MSNRSFEQQPTRPPDVNLSSSLASDLAPIVGAQLSSSRPTDSTIIQADGRLNFDYHVYPHTAPIDMKDFQPVIDKATKIQFTTAASDSKSKVVPDYILGADGKLRRNPEKKAPNKDGSVNIELASSNKSEADAKKVANDLQRQWAKDMIQRWQHSPDHKGQDVPQEWNDLVSKQDVPTPAPSGGQSAPSGDQSAPSGDQSAPSGDQSAPSGDQSVPSGDQSAPSGDQSAPSGDQSAPSGDQSAPSGDQSAPSGNQSAPSGDQSIPSGDQSMPSGNQSSSDGGSRSSGSGGGSPSGGGTARGGGDGGAGSSAGVPRGGTDSGSSPAADTSAPRGDVTPLKDIPSPTDSATNLAHLQAAIDRANQGGRPLSVLQYGDSHIAAGTEPKTIENALKQMAPTEYSTQAKVGISADYPLQNPQQWLDQPIQKANPDLVILSFGSNDSAGNVDKNAYEQTYQKLIDNVRERAPNAAILIVGPSDGDSITGANKGNTLPGLDNVVQAQKEVAAKNGLDFFDLRASMGGAGSIEDWHNKGLAGGDKLHFTTKGYEVIGQSIAGHITNELNKKA